MFAEALIVTDEIYDVQESDNCPRTFETHFTIQSGTATCSESFVKHFLRVPQFLKVPQAVGTSNGWPVELSAHVELRKVDLII